MRTKALTTGMLVLAVLSLAAWSGARAQGVNGSPESPKTVIGPRNPFLADGADALASGDAQRGVELTEKGLAFARGSFEHKAALSNLCAGYLMIDELAKALEACDLVLEKDPEFWRAYNNRALVYMRLGRYAESEADVMRGQALRPGSRHLRLTKAMLLDAVDPVVPTVEIDERRAPGKDVDDAGEF